MTRSFGYVWTVGFLFMLAAGKTLAAEPANNGDDRLRATLRDTTRQLNSAQTDLTALQATHAALAEENKVLTLKYEALKKQMDAGKTAADKAAAGLGAQLADMKAANARLTEALEKSRADGDAAVQAARAADARGAKLTSENNVLQRRIAERETKNLALFMLANQILTRFEDFSLGNAIAAREPFVGKTRVRLENLVQDYQDKILDQRATP